MTDHHPDDADRPDYDDAELDEMLTEGMEEMLAKLEAGFDPVAGLADVYARCGKAGPRTSQRPSPAPAAEPARLSASGRMLQEVCDRIDMLDACLESVIRASRNTPFAGAAFIEAARPVLRQLRMGLANRVLPRDEATHLIDHFQHNLEETDRILRAQSSSSLHEVVHARLGGQAQFGGPVTEQTHRLREMIIRLYEDVGYAASLQPAL
jgi:hypothetical protein